MVFFSVITATRCQSIFSMHARAGWPLFAHAIEEVTPEEAGLCMYYLPSHNQKNWKLRIWTKYSEVIESKPLNCPKQTSLIATLFRLAF